MLGVHLYVPVHELKKINAQDGVERCKLEVLQYWLTNSKTLSWREIVRALEQLNMVALAERLKSEYLSGVCVCVCVCVCARARTRACTCV